MNLNGIRINRCGLLVIFIAAVILVYYANNIHNNGDKKSNVSTNIRQLLIAAVEAAVNGGKEVRLISESKTMDIKSKGKTKEGADNPVTNADLRSHCVMFYGLHKMFPSVKIISEETVSENDCPVKKSLELDGLDLHYGDLHRLLDDFVDTKDITVWIDPLDATQEFTEKLFHYVTTMVCVAVKGKPTIGVIHFPFSKITYWAWLGKTVSENLASVREQQLTNNNQKESEISSPIFIVSRSHAGAVDNITKSAFGINSKVIAAGGAGYKTMQLIHHNASAYIHTTRIKKWDICSGNAILSELGGKMTTIQENHKEIDYSSDTNPVNEFGLLASLTNHDLYAEKLSNVL